MDNCTIPSLAQCAQEDGAVPGGLTTCCVHILKSDFKLAKQILWFFPQGGTGDPEFMII